MAHSVAARVREALVRVVLASNARGAQRTLALEAVHQIVTDTTVVAAIRCAC